jgi:hypothetical protein
MGYWIPRQVIQPIRNKVDMNAIFGIKAKKGKKIEIFQFIVMVNHYGDRCYYRSGLLAMPIDKPLIASIGLG